MIQITDKAKCCGCTACVSACPKHCIKMCSDQEGFLYPKVEEDACIDCGLCEKKCPVINPPTNYEITSAYIARNKDIDIVKKSSSDGFFDALCKVVIEHNGVVIGATFTEDFSVHHECAETLEKCQKFYGSKYVQSNLENVFCQTKDYLMSGKLVCFSGTPCQIAGLKQYLGKDYENLILVDLVCHGVPSPMLWKKYLSMMESKYNSKVKKVNFRSKKYGYQSSSMNLEFENKMEYFGTARIDVMLKSFFSHIALRPVCYECSFKGKDRPADITIYDCWHGASILGTRDDDLGYTSVLVRGNKGRNITEQLEKYVVLEQRPIDQVIPINGGMLVSCAKKHKKRNEFYNVLNEEGLEKAFDRFLPVTRKDYAVEKIKAILSSTGLLHKISRARKLLKKKVEKLKS